MCIHVFIKFIELLQMSSIIYIFTTNNTKFDDIDEFVESIDGAAVYAELSDEIDESIEYINLSSNNFNTEYINTYANEHNIDLFLVLKNDYVEIRQLSVSNSKFWKCFFDSAKDLLLSLDNQDFTLHDLSINGIENTHFHQEVEKRRY